MSTGTDALNSEEQAVADFLSEYAEAFASADLQRIKPFFLNDERLTYFEGTFVDRGWSSYQEHLTEELPLFSETRYIISAVNPEVTADMAFATFAWSLDTTVISDQFPDGKHPVSMKGVGTVVLVVYGGRWRIRHMHTAREQSRRN